MDALWFENAVCYAVDVSMSRDGNGDGTGELAGPVDGLGYRWVRGQQAAPRE